MAQFRKLLPEITRAKHIPWKFLFRFVFTLLTLTALWIMLNKQLQSMEDIWSVARQRVKEGSLFWLHCLLVMVPVNWALESFKWQLLVNKLESISFTAALKSTLTGLLSGLALPAQVGDIAGRVASLNIRRRSAAIGAALISGGIQFYAAVLIGLWAFWFLWERLEFSATAFFLVMLLLITLILIGLTLFSARSFLLAKLPGRGVGLKIRSSLGVMASYADRELLVAFGIGLLRYATYLAQFVAGLLFFDFPMTVTEMTASAALVLMVKTIMPAVNLLGDLGLRGVTAIVIFAKFGIPADEVMAATLLIWLTNILLPALVGILLVWRRT